MYDSMVVTEKEMSYIRELVYVLYPELSIIYISAEKSKKRPAEEGLNLGDVGFAQLIEKGKVDLYHQIIGRELDCYVDTFSNDITKNADLYWYIVVTVFEKQKTLREENKNRYSIKEKGTNIVNNIKRILKIKIDYYGNIGI